VSGRLTLARVTTFSYGLVAVGFILGGASAALAQSAADHAAQAHGSPIVQGHPVQPRPEVVEERWRHHEQSLGAKQGTRPEDSSTPK
jgi:hypothetical protein